MDLVSESTDKAKLAGWREHWIIRKGKDLSSIWNWLREVCELELEEGGEAFLALS